MEIIVAGRRFEVSDAIHQYAREKAAKLPRYFDRILRIEVILGHSENDREFDAEIIVDAEHVDDFVAKVTGADVYGCIDAAVDKLERQLTDHKERVRKRKGKHPTSG